jgi:hypothetical protein
MARTLKSVPQAMTETQARAAVAEIKAAVTTAYETLVLLWEKRAWLVLGYDDFDTMCVAEFGRVVLSRGERQELVIDLRARGMSTRAIGSALGVSVGTVHKDAGVQNRTPARRDLPGAEYSAPAEGDERTTGLDGKRYKASREPVEPIVPRNVRKVTTEADRDAGRLHFLLTVLKGGALIGAIGGYGGLPTIWKRHEDLIPHLNNEQIEEYLAHLRSARTALTETIHYIEKERN